MLHFPAGAYDIYYMKKYIPLLISGLLMIFVGLYMILKPSGFVTVVFSVFGIYLALDGVRTLISAQRLGSALGRFRSVLIGRALLSMLVGLIVIIAAIAAPTLIPTLLVYIIAAAFLVAAAVDLADLLVMKKAGIPSGSLGLETLLSFVFSLLLFLFPNFLTGVVMTVFAAILFASGAVMAYGAVSAMIYSRKFNSL